MFTSTDIRPVIQYQVHELVLSGNCNDIKNLGLSLGEGVDGLGSKYYIVSRISKVGRQNLFENKKLAVRLQELS